MIQKDIVPNAVFLVIFVTELVCLPQAAGFDKAARQQTTLL
jgi:hypothetical protein